MGPIEFLDAKIAQEPSKRTRRQLIADRKWVLTGCMGTIEWPTGVGKTRIATEAIQVMRREDFQRDYLVVVPTLQLKQQWEEGLTSLGLIQNGRVMVINSVARLKEVMQTELLILDEIHRYAAKTFARVFTKVKYEYVLGLTATLKRLDKKHDILVRYAPIVDKMSVLEARREGYIAVYREYNLAVKMTDEEREKYRSWAKNYAYCLDKFHQDFSLMKFSSMGLKPWRIDPTLPWAIPTVVEYAKRLGWRGNSPSQAAELMFLNESSPRGEKGRDLWGNDGHPYSPQKLFVHALNGMRCIREMKDFIYNHPGKLAVTIELISRFARKTIVFGQSIKRTEEIHAALPEQTVLYHSKMRAPAKRVSLERMANDPGVLAILTALSLDQGFDQPNIQLGIIESRTTSPTQQIQRRGRVIRLHVFDDGSDKEGVIINTYVEDTKDYDWTKKAQVGSGPARWVESIEEIAQAEGLPAIPTTVYS